MRGKKVDQFAGELDHFSHALLRGKDAHADITEGTADIAVIEAIQRSAKSGKVEKVMWVQEDEYGDKKDARSFRGQEEPQNLVDVEAASNE